MLYHCTYIVMRSFTMSWTKKKPYHLITPYHIKVLIHKILRFWKFKLINTSIKPHIMPCGLKTLIKNITPMQFEAMLNKFRIMFTIIWDIEMVIYQDKWVFIMWVLIWIVTICYMHKYGYLKWMPMHGLHLNFAKSTIETIEFSMISHRPWSVWPTT